VIVVAVVAIVAGVALLNKENQVRKAISEGKTVREIAKEYKVNFTQIKMIRDGKAISANEILKKQKIDLENECEEGKRRAEENERRAWLAKQERDKWVSETNELKRARAEEEDKERRKSWFIEQKNATLEYIAKQEEADRIKWEAAEAERLREEKAAQEAREREARERKREADEKSWNEKIEAIQERINREREAEHKEFLDQLEKDSNPNMRMLGVVLKIAGEFDKENVARKKSFSDWL
jgi:hypothetical protein